MLLAAMAGDLSYKVIEQAVHIHPTVSELIPTLLEGLKPLARPGLMAAMPDRREELERIAALTLGHYDASAEAFWVGTRDHDVGRTSRRCCAIWRAPAVRDPRPRLRPRPRPRHLPRPRPRGDRRRRRGPVRRDGPRPQRLRGLAAEPARPRPARRLASTASSPTRCCSTCPASELPRVLVELRTALRPRGVLFSSNSARPGRGRLEQRPLQRLSRARRMAAHGAEAGFVELEHYYRPEGRPREQQPWLASVWRRGDDPPR